MVLGLETLQSLAGRFLQEGAEEEESPYLHN